MRVIFETNAGVFAGYLTSRGEILIYSGDDETPIATVQPLMKRKPAFDTSADGIMRTVREWLESNQERLEIETITALFTPPGRP